jgi:ABC-2 type transport system permease protein
MNPPGRAELFLRAAAGRAYPRVRGSLREKSWLFYETLLPLLGTIAFIYVYRALGAPERFTAYVVMGGAAAAFWMNVLWMMAAQFYWEKRTGNLDLFMISPCGLWPILFGMSVGGILATLLRATGVVAVGVVLFDAHFDLARLPMLVLVFVLTLVALYGLGTALSSLFLYWGREAWHTVNLFVEPVFLLSGVYFPVSSMVRGLGLAGCAIPLTLGLDALRTLLVPDAHTALLSLPVEVTLLAALGVIYALIARAALRRMEHLARAEGRLSRRY